MRLLAITTVTGREGIGSMKWRWTLLVMLSVIFGATPSWPGLAGEAPTAATATQAFYFWYVALPESRNGQPGWAMALDRKPPVLSARLRRALAADLASKARASGMIEGIDFDPFLDGQDPCLRFAIGKTRSEGAHELVQVVPTCDAASRRKPINVALVRSGAQFVIDDIVYADGRTLHRALAAS